MRLHRKSLVAISPSLECATLLLPSIQSNLVRDIFNNQDKLNPKFNSKVDTLIQQILLKITPKKAVDGAVRVTGKALAALAECYVEAVNRPGALPDLDQGWQAIITLELKEYSYRLVREYEAEMEKALEEKLPIEEKCLLCIHREILSEKKSFLKKEICRINPLRSSDEDAQPLLHQLEQDIVQWNKQSANEEPKVIGGSLLQFTTLNFLKSKQHCENLLMQLMSNSNIQHEVSEALRNSQPLNIEIKVEEIIAQYK